MKSSFLKIVAAFIVLNLAMYPAFSQDGKTGKTSVERTVSEQHFTFNATSATPVSGRFIVLNYPYSISISGDSLVSDLPYYGRAYVAPYNPEDGPLTFTSTHFSYTITRADEKKQEITVETRDRPYNVKFYFTIFNDGTAQLQAVSTDRQPINYDGEVTNKTAMK